MLNEFLKKEAPIQGLTGLGGGVPSRLLTLASGTTTYVDDVFSMFLYDGTGSAQTITNGINLDGKGGLVWAKSRTGTRNHILSDTERGTGKVLFSNLTSGTDTDATTITSYNSNGFTMGTSSLKMNTSGEEFVSWTFRKCPGFFDVVTYTGNGTSGRTVAHSLGSTPGAVFIKCTSNTDDWWVWHRSVSTGNLSGNNLLKLNSDDLAVSRTYIGTVNSSTFELGTDNAVNGSGKSYVAYIFAHNDGSFGEDSDEAVIKCGSYTGDDSNFNLVTLGFEPQFLLIKNATTGSTNWMMFDVMRGLPIVSGATARAIYGNTGAAETNNNSVYPSATGFTPRAAGSYTNTSGDTFIYIAIRRPHKPPEAGTDVFKPELLTSASQTFNPGFAPDMNWHMFNRSSSSGFAITGTRLTGNGSYLQTYSDAAEAGSGSNWEYDAPTGKFTQGISSGSTGGGIEYFFKRAPGFMDIVAYDGSASAQNINHNLGVAPELIITKRRDTTSELGWIVSSYYYFNSTRWDRNGRLNQDVGLVGGGVYEPASSHSATQYPVPSHTSDVNASGGTYLALLFASLDGISKVGSYTGTGSNIDVDCGFTAGARFVLIKRTDSTGDWFIYDSARGIVSGNDPYLKLNGGTEVTGTDYIDPLNAGFTVTSSAPSGMNGDGGTYLFLAIA